ncbi:MAG: imidazolonepropionase [Myxococcales bacterium]|nr:imidazolonepropionase [Myxococcales bacterium]
MSGFTAIWLSQIVAIVGGTVYPGDGTKLEQATVIIEGKSITAVGPSVPVPPGATVIDAKGQIVTPGLFDPYTHLGLVEIEAIEETNDIDSGEPDSIRAAQLAAESYNPDSSVIPVQRAHGVTTVLIAPEGGLVGGQAAIVDLDRDGGRPGVVSSSVGMVAYFGGSVAPSRGALLLTLRELFDDARAYAKNKAAFDKNQYRRLSTSKRDLEALQPVVQGRLPLLIHVNRRVDIESVIAFAAEQKVKLVLVGATEAWTVAEALARTHIPVILDPVENAPEDFDRYHARADNAALLEKAGVPVMLSTFSAHNVRKLRQWAGNAVREGMTQAGALRAVTSLPAEVFGLKDHGRLAAGQVANVVVWSGDPFELSTVARRVFIRGRDVGTDHRQKALLDRYRTLPLQK